jgi:hypothetical protein
MLKIIFVSAAALSANAAEDMVATQQFELTAEQNDRW